MAEVKENTYRKELADYVKLAGQHLIDHADDIVADVPYISDFNIDISFDQDRGSIPEITVSTRMFPDYEKVQEIMEKYSN